MILGCEARVAIRLSFGCAKGHRTLMPLDELGSQHFQLQGDMIEIHIVTLVLEHLPPVIHSVALRDECRQALEVHIARDVAGGIP